MKPIHYFIHAYDCIVTSCIKLTFMFAEALKGMEKVAEHINEMQRIHEEYGAIFDHLFRQHQKSCKQVNNIVPFYIYILCDKIYYFLQPIDLSPGDLLYYGGVEWLNISDFLGKIKKGLELHAMCFVFKSAVVFLCKERLRQKKKLMVSENFLFLQPHLHNAISTTSHTLMSTVMIDECFSGCIK